jgi:hypothetical protein
MAKHRSDKPRTVSDQDVMLTTLRTCADAGTEDSVRPQDIARRLLPDHWRTLLKRIRLMGKQLALEGDLLILRKGEPADPNDFKGLITLQITPQGYERLEKEEAAAEADVTF